MSTIVVALGGNALQLRGEPVDARRQRARVADAAAVLATIAPGNRLVITHGNGPQVGLLALQADAYGEVAPFPLDVLDAETEGMIGYVIDQELANELPGHPVATLLTQVEVRADDPGFRAPSKPIGPVYDEATARRLTVQRGWLLGPDGDGYRRLVPSPAPLAVIELSTIELLLDAGVIVVCGGGGGIPVLRVGDALVGVEAVVDKDATAALLAESLGADVLALLTDTDAVYEAWGTPQQQPIGRTEPAALAALSFAAGSMGPKVAAAISFVTRTGRRAAIGDLQDAEAVIAGTAGTQVVPDGSTSKPWQRAG